ncbi:hypothetical protein LP032_096 [Listeria phage LP-032]|uniref:Uncharacterized protein n=8 Tax=Homburgvirus TaxID=1921125 RepID=A0A6C0R1Z5_9CAUD|nr:hypothetical protein LP110_035 [Listeria phage LP-110]YP_008240539.1 hypothetical protein LP037_061 [Listeria phage LP-037]YP_009044154.1 hypothetical protein LP026_069 [Listeria phage LP-026]AHL18945.1 hypothetical protein LP032_096 [Listeria phage LP-032]AWY07729.1 hypothetical protein [Listeria phage LP-KV022]QDK04593.1 hypothetical protein FK481_0079 [Listeria phage LP-010]QDK04703.1 hypothetical protein FK482_0081 [Listeria phage LP-013]QHZ59424.1 hypothetical protein FK483_0081 [Lis
MEKYWHVTCKDKDNNARYIQLLSKGFDDIIVRYSKEKEDAFPFESKEHALAYVSFCTTMHNGKHDYNVIDPNVGKVFFITYRGVRYYLEEIKIHPTMDCETLWTPTYEFAMNISDDEFFEGIYYIVKGSKKRVEHYATGHINEVPTDSPFYYSEGEPTLQEEGN